MRTAWTRWGLPVAAGATLWLLLAGPEHVIGWPIESLLLLLVAVLLVRAVSRMPETVPAASDGVLARLRPGPVLAGLGAVYLAASVSLLAARGGDPAVGAAVIVRSLALLGVAWAILAQALPARPSAGLGMSALEKFAWARWIGTSILLAFTAPLLFRPGPPVDGAVARFVEPGWIVDAILFSAIVLTGTRRSVVRDERDDAIAAHAGRAALAACSLSLVVISVFVEKEEYSGLWRDAPGPWFAACLIVCVVATWWVEASVTVHGYWRDRR